MKPLPHHFRKDGFDLTQLKRSEKAAIYLQSKPGQRPAYEVIRIRVNKEWSAFGQQFPASEAYPSSEQWGQNGWIFRDLNAAEAKFEELNKP